MKGTRSGGRRGWNVAFVCLLVLVAGAAGARAVLFKSTGDPSYNTTAPTGSLTNSGWQYEGSWSNYLATPIAPRYFIAANHVGGQIGDIFTFNGYAYHTVWVTNTPGVDLNVWRVAETFPIYASLYTNSNEVGKHCTVFGRGTQRGSPVIVSGKTNGWNWGTEDFVERWGENDIAAVASGGYLYATFDAGGNSNECDLSVDDSSGGLFIQDSGVWKLAGIHHTVDGYFSYTGSSTDEFIAALTDSRGLYYGSGTNWTLIGGPTPVPTGFYSTRISANVAWINSVIDYLPGDDLQITKVQVIGNDISVSFASGSNRLYHVDRRDDLGSGSWTTFTNNVEGTGGIVSVLDTNAATLPQRFYRVGLIQ
ncbi:MAG TPA: hypothetical protein VL486_12990 [Verrucomicrobiae bacterium]|nr:hypothetical protein [Verrucomicrobiae bacterium]